MNCQHCHRTAQQHVWIEMTSGRVRLTLCAGCHRRYRAMRGEIDWLPATLPASQSEAKLPLPIKSIQLTMHAETTAAGGTSLITVSKQGTALMTTSTVDLANLRCPDCGTTYLDFRRTGRLGCPYDYVVFRDGLLPLLDRLQRAKHHKGKKPVKHGEVIEQHGEIRGLRLQLKEAVDAEEYERASEIRDMIRSKERQHGSE